MNEAQIAQIKRLPRSNQKGETNLIVNVLHVSNLESTSKVGVEVVETEQLPFLWVTAYPVRDEEFKVDSSKNFFDQVAILLKNSN